MLPAVTDLAPQQKPAGALLTRHEAALYINNELGRPMSFSTLQKLCAWGEGPPVATWWGRRPLYSREGIRAWTENRGRKHARAKVTEA
jgi:hypothetical protein